MTTSTQFRLTLVIVLGFFHSLTFAQAREGNGVAHGTVNIFLATRTGLLLSLIAALAAGIGQLAMDKSYSNLTIIQFVQLRDFLALRDRLFRAIPQTPLAQPFGMFSWVYPLGGAAGIRFLANRFYSLAKTYVVALNLMEEIQRIAGLPPVDTPSIITIAGYEKGSLWVGQVALTPIVVNGAIQYELPTELPILKQVVGGHLTRETAGIDSLALELLNNPAPHADYDPIFGIYAKSEAANGTPLTLDELKTLANRIERMTADKYRNYVGGEPQVAVLADEKASLLPHLIPLALPERSQLMLTMTGDTVSGGLMSNDNPGTVVLVVGGSYSNCVVVLDGFIFLR